MWVRFERDFDWSPPEKRHQVTIAFKKGMEVFVRRICAAEAIAARAAVPVPKMENDNGS